MRRALHATLLAIVSLTLVIPVAAQVADEDEDEAGLEDEEGLEEEEEEEAEEEEEYEPVEDAETGVGVPRTLCHGRRIRRVRVLGNRRVGDDDVLASVRSRAGNVCTDDRVADDARALWDLGFFDDIRVEAEPAEDRVDLIFRVRERPSISAVRYEGNSSVGNSDIDEVVELRAGSILSMQEVQRQLTRIRDLYAEKGYFLARIEPRLVRQPNNEVEVVFRIQEGDEVVVRRIRFVGNRHISGGDLRGIMQTGETGFFSFLTNNDNFQDERFDEDVTRLQAIYYDRGYLTMRVGTPRIELTPDRRFIDITIPLAEGPRFRIGRLRVIEQDDDGNEVDPLGGRRQVRELVAAEPGDWFSRTALGTSLLAVTRHYRDAGYAHVDVQPETDLDLERNTVDLSIVVRRGPLTRIERINVRGNTKTRDSVIRREIRIAEGDLYSQTQLEQSRAFIQALGYFERVELSESDGSAPDRIVVNVEVAERPTGTFNVGAGFSSIEAFIFTAQVQQQNLFGNGQSLNLQLQLSGLRQLVQIQFVEPYFFGTDWTFAIELFKTVRQFSSFTRDSTGGSLSFGHPIFDRRLSLFAQYRADYVQIGPRTGGFGAGQGLFQLNLLPIENNFRNGLQSSLRLTVTWDSRDNRIYPQNGLYASWSTEVADEVIGSATSWVRHRAFFRWYWELFSGVVLKMNTEWGLIASRQAPGPPVFERFYLGGIFNVRGFPLNSLGPRVGVPRTYAPPDGGIVPQFGEPVGGNMQLYYNLELEFPIIQQVGIRGVIFTDGGNAWNLDEYICQLPQPSEYVSSSDPCRVDLFDLRTSWGFGIRWISPLGPLRFEWGLPFMRIPGREQDIDFQFTIGNFF
ncbi:outer membrane protein assembly factor BamA [Sandaracinus amylolyticus]|uniref:outer membrane protein assembly factor BamA n=1 Tax=Sandaracinus amylolyticus TaxID=927083 RepID=UPI001F029CA1|nr:outer membrane protein assembly factor BamA [Sandaracinus amylolyticus]UJR79150.1 Outer membrane protein assembly factor YaeT [Sandaracinus amylolyticus]